MNEVFDNKSNTLIFAYNSDGGCTPLDHYYK